MSEGSFSGKRIQARDLGSLRPAGAGKKGAPRRERPRLSVLHAVQPAYAVSCFTSTAAVPGPLSGVWPEAATVTAASLGKASKAWSMKSLIPCGTVEASATTSRASGMGLPEKFSDQVMGASCEGARVPSRGQGAPTAKTSCPPLRKGGPKPEKMVGIGGGMLHWLVTSAARQGVPPPGGPGCCQGGGGEGL